MAGVLKPGGSSRGSGNWIASTLGRKMERLKGGSFGVALPGLATPSAAVREDGREATTVAGCRSENSNPSSPKSAQQGTSKNASSSLDEGRSSTATAGTMLMQLNKGSFGEVGKKQKSAGAGFNNGTAVTAGPSRSRPSGLKIPARSILKHEVEAADQGGELAPRTLIENADSGTLNRTSEHPATGSAEMEMSPRSAALAQSIRAGEASTDDLEQAAEYLLESGPFCLDPAGFHIPRLPEQPTRGVPLYLLAAHPAVAWEVDGVLQTLIGAAKRTGDPEDVW